MDSLCSDPEVPDPSEIHEWKLNAVGELNIVWTTFQPAPDVILNEMSCSSSGTCKKPACPCLHGGLKCTVQDKLKRIVQTWSMEDSYEQDSSDSNSDQLIAINCVTNRVA